MSSTPSAEDLQAVTASWREAAKRLVTVLRHAPDDELRCAVLERLAQRFGAFGYPAFLKLVLIVAEHGDVRARSVLAEAIAAALRRGTLPGGELTSWGASRFWSAEGDVRAGVLADQYLGFAPSRRLGPIEYLTVWHCQRTQRTYLGENTYRNALAALVALIDHDPDARRLYAARIEADIADASAGAYTHLVRARLEALALAWAQNHPPAAIAAAAVQATRA